jgi:hypothetical protein
MTADRNKSRAHLAQQICDLPLDLTTEQRRAALNRIRGDLPRDEVCAVLVLLGQMQSGQLTLHTVLRTLARLRKMLGVPPKDLAAALSPHLKAYHLIECAKYLENVGAHMHLSADKKCAECGSGFHNLTGLNEIALRFTRADARYCSAKCKQKAYRKRVTAATSPPMSKRHRVTDGTHGAMH